MKSKKLSPTYFPFTFISPSLVELMSKCFQQVVVYEPAHSRPDEALKQWTDSGFLDVRRPFDTIIDKRALEAALRDIKAWGLIHQHADMALLKHVGHAFVPASPETPAIKSEIKGRKGLNRDEGQDTDFSVQLFLHLAEEFDRESNDLNQQLAMVDNQYQSLQRSFQQDQDEGSVGAGISTQPVAAGTENPRPLVFDKRMVAWNHLFQKDSAPSSLLFTDSETAFDGLLEQVEEKVELLKVDAPAADGNTPAQGPWPEQVPEILQKVLMTPWDPGLLDEVRVIGQEIASGADAWQKSGAPSEDRVYSIIWFAVPGLNGRTLLNRRLGRQEETGGWDGIKNTVVGLVQERRKHL